MINHRLLLSSVYDHCPRSSFKVLYLPTKPPSSHQPSRLQMAYTTSQVNLRVLDCLLNRDSADNKREQGSAHMGEDEKPV